MCLYEVVYFNGFQVLDSFGGLSVEVPSRYYFLVCLSRGPELRFMFLESHEETLSAMGMFTRSQMSSAKLF